MKPLLAIFALLFASLSSAGTVNLSWRDNSANEDGFVIEARQADSQEWREVARVPADQTTATVEAAGNDAYRVAAFNAAGQSGYSNEAAYGVPATPGDTLRIQSVTEVIRTESTTTKTTTFDQ